MTCLCMNPRSQVSFHPRLALKPNPEMRRRITRVALPNAVENTLFQLAKVVLGALIATFGTSQIAANGIGQTFWSLAACMCVSMSPVFITVIGQCMGAKDLEAADWYMKKLTRLSVALSMLWNALVLALMPLILPLYSITAETRQLVFTIVIIHNCFAALVQPFSMPLSAGMRAAGDVRFAMWSSLFATVVCRTLFSFVLGLWMGLGVIGIALAMGIDWCIKGGLDIWRWKTGKWKAYRLI